MRRIPSLNALKAFESAARLASITRAADELHVTQSAVSRQIRSLEEEIGLTLFQRVHRGVVLSPEGRTLAATLSESFGRIADTVDRLARDRNALKLTVLPTVGVRWLWPRLHRFEGRHPEIRLQVDILWNSFAPDDVEHDAGIRYGPGGWSAACLTELLPERLTPVCATAYAERHGLPVAAAGFATLRLLHTSPTHEDWRVWARGWGGGVFDVDHGLDFDMLDMALRAAESGRGLAIADLCMIQDELAQGRLVAPFPAIVPGSEAHYFVTKDPDREKPAIDLLRRWLVEEAARMGIA